MSLAEIAAADPEAADTMPEPIRWVWDVTLIYPNGRRAVIATYRSQAEAARALDLLGLKGRDPPRRAWFRWRWPRRAEFP